MLVVGVNEALQVTQVLLELLRELQILLISPRRAQRMNLSRQRRRSVGQILIELLEHLRELPQLTRINNGLSHDQFMWGLRMKDAATVEC